MTCPLRPDLFPNCTEPNCNCRQPKRPADTRSFAQRKRDQRQRERDNPAYARALRKSNQAWDLAGMARQDGDHKAELQYTEEARRWQAEAAALC